MKTTVLFLLALVAASLAADIPPAAKTVGILGQPAAIAISGAKAFSEADLRFALAGSYEYLIAAHPSAPAEAYVAKVRDLIERGYKDSGYRDARVNAAIAPDGQKLLVQVEEGQPFVQGEIRIAGPTKMPADALVAVLTGKPTPPADPLAARVTEFIEDRAAPKRKAALEKLLPKTAALPQGVENKGKIVLSRGDEITWNNAAALSKADTPFWEPGKPYSFAPKRPGSAEAQVLRALQERGHWFSEVTLEPLADPGTGRVNLTCRFADRPAPVIGEISVVGLQRDTAAEVIAASGLKTGEPFTGETIRQANLKLWNCARFVNFDLTAKRRDPQSPEIDIVIDVDECPEMQPLREPMNRAQQALARLAGWMSTELAKQEFSLSLDFDPAKSFIFALSPKDGAALVIENRPAEIFGIQADARQLQFIAANGKAAAVGAVSTVGAGFKGMLQLTPAARDRAPGARWKSFDFAAGVATKDENVQAIRLNTLAAPVVMCSEPAARKGGEGLTFSNGNVRITFEGGAIFEFVEATGELISLQADAPFGTVHATATLAVKPGEVARLRGKLEAAQRGSDAARLPEDSFLGILADTSTIKAFFGQSAQGLDWETLGAFGRLFERGWKSLAATPPEQAKPGKAAFSIPPDFDAGTSWMVLLAGPLYFQWAQELWPAGAWPAKLAREVFYVMAGQSHYTGLVMEELDKDPDLGPFGSVLVAELLDKVDPRSAARFRLRARAHSTVEDLRRELTLLLKVRGKGSELLSAMFSGPAEIDAAAFERLAGSLGLEFAGEIKAWRTSLAAAKVEATAEGALPFILRGWERGGRAAFLARLDAASVGGAQPDGWVVAALVNGQPISRCALDVLAPAFKLDQRIPARGNAAAAAPAAEARARMLEALIALRLVHQNYIRDGGQVSEELLQKAFKSLLRGEPSVVQKLLSQAEISPQALTALVEQWVGYCALEEQIKGALKPPTPEEILAAEKQNPVGVVERVHLRFLRAPKTPEGRKILEQTRDAGPKTWFQQPWKIAAEKPDLLEAGDYPDLDHETLTEALTKAAFALDEGATGAIVESGDFLYLPHLMQKGASKQMLADTRAEFLAQLDRERLQKKLLEQIEKFRAESSIVMVKEPPIENVPPPAKGVVRLEGEALKVAGNEKTRVRKMMMAEWGKDHWSGGFQAQVNGEEGGWVEWDFDAAAEGPTEFTLYATRAVNFGKIKVALDGQPFDPELDLYSGASVIPSGPRILGRRNLTRGPHKLRISVIGRNPEATGFDFGFDALDLRTEPPTK